MSSYKQIAKSSGLIAFVSIFQMAFGLLRNKAIALMLGAKGFGIYGLYQVFIETAITFSSLGLDKSGVRHIAKSSDNIELRDKFIWIFTRSLIVTSLFTSILCAVFAKKIGESLFGSNDYYIGILIACIVVCIRSISQGQISILNGIRDLKSLGLSQILSAIIGSISSVAFVYFLGLDGLPLSFLSFGISSILFSYIFVRKQNITVVKPSQKEFVEGFKSLLKLGLGFSIAGAIASLFTYLSRTYINSEFDLTVVGIYQACWLISNMYIGIILTAMGVDFMPRLMKSIGDKSLVRKMVNEQMELGTLLAGVGVVLLMIFSDQILTILYSSEFSAGATIIRWQILGVSLRVLGFPLSHSVMAFNKPIWYVVIQGIFALIEYLLLIFFTKKYGFDGLGISYFAGYIIFMIMWYIATSKLFGFRFSRKLVYILMITWIGAFLSFIIVTSLDGLLLVLVGIIFTILYLIIVNMFMDKFMGLSLLNIIKNKIRKK